MANTSKLLAMAKRHVVKIFTDGACSGNPGKGGWAAILQCNGVKKEISGGFLHTTNNRMELLAVIKSLEVLKYPCEVTVVSDSKYVIDSVIKGRLSKWLKTRNFAGKKNKDLWERLVKLIRVHNITFQHIKGHSGHPENERCDQLAVAAYKENNLLEIDSFYINQNT